jgi:hypothetical protein
MIITIMTRLTIRPTVIEKVLLFEGIVTTVLTPS